MTMSHRVFLWGMRLLFFGLEGREEKRVGHRGEGGVGAQGLLPGKQAPSLRVHPPEGREFDLRGWEIRNLLV